MNLTILVIDDSEDDQRLYQRAFRDFDGSLNLAMAQSAEAGFARNADTSPDSKRPDLILLDYNLPDMD
jgi:CheY-like chemotaxis protein